MIATAPVNIASHLVAMAERQPDVDALLSNPRRSGGGKIEYTHTTFKQLNDLSDRLMRGFRELGIGVGTRVALCVRPGVEFFAVTFALFKLGAIPVLIDPGIGLRNFGKCLGQAKPAAFVAIPIVHLLRRTLGWAKETNRLNISTGMFGGTSLRKVLRLGDRKSNGPERMEHASEAAILFTSGSTGPAKGVMYTHENFNGQIEALKRTYDIEPGELDLATFPLFGLFGPALGMTTVLPEMDFTRPGFVEPRNIIDPIRQLNITNIFGSPALIDRVSRYGEEQGIRLPSLRRVISAGAPASAPVLKRFSKMLTGSAEIFTPYGATEALPVSSIGRHEILGKTAGLTDPGKGVCVGRPVEGIRARIIGLTDAAIAEWSDDLELPAGQIGEIVVQGAVVTGGYFDRVEATVLAKIRDAASSSIYHRMGDVGYFDESGRLWFCGRKSQRVRTFNGDLFSTPVEGIFNTHPDVARSALVGVAREYGQMPVVCIELRKEALSNRPGLQKELIKLAQSHSMTSIIRCFIFHPGFPVDIRHNAKINREQLTVWAQKRLRKPRSHEESRRG